MRCSKEEFVYVPDPQGHADHVNRYYVEGSGGTEAQ